MSYSRWSDKSEWYVFWESQNKKTDEPKLAIWHTSHTDLFYSTYTKLKQAKGDYSFVYEFKGNQEEHCKECIENFIVDVEWDLMRVSLGDMRSLLIDDWRPWWFGKEDILKHFSEKTIEAINESEHFNIEDGKLVDVR